MLSRRKTRAWKIQYDAASYRLEKARRKLHPACCKFKRLLFRTVMWLPSALAALVVFFFPIGSHLACPGSHCLRHFRVPIPRTATVLSAPGLPPGLELVEALISGSANARFGATPFWNREAALSSEMSFSARTDVDTIDNDYAKLAVSLGATEVLRGDFHVSDLALSCWQYIPRKNIFRIDAGTMWIVNCQTPADVRKRNFYASFFGPESDIPTFYKVIEGVTPLD